MVIDRQLLLLFVVGMLTAGLWACTQPQAVAVDTPVPIPTMTVIPQATAVPSTITQLDQVALPPVDWAAVEGDVAVLGSSTVYPLTQHLAQQLQEVGFRGHVVVESIGTGAGFEMFCNSGQGDVVNASRPIRVTEIQACEANGRPPIEFRVGTDALAVVVSQQNDFATDVTEAELRHLFSTAETWADVRPSWPAEPILRFIPGTDSGTFDYFAEEVFESNPRPLLSASNLVTSEDDNELVRGVESSPYAVGFFGYAYYQAEAAELRPLAIEGILPTGQAVETGVYPLARPLFIYSTAEIMQNKPQVAAFINYYLTHVSEEIIAVGYFPISEEQLAVAKLAWLVGNE